MTKNMKTFLDAIQNNAELKEEVSKIDKKAQGKGEAYLDEYIAAAKEFGITLTEEDLTEDEHSKLPDDELQAVSGGSELGCVVGGSDISTSETRHCGCFVVGAVKSCGCVVVGSHTEG